VVNIKNGENHEVMLQKDIHFLKASTSRDPGTLRPGRVSKARLWGSSYYSDPHF
jgi:hypothetical protein